MEKQTQNFECEFDIQTKEVTKKTIQGQKVFLQIRYIQSKADLIPKSDFEKIQMLKAKGLKCQAIKEANKNRIVTDGVAFLSSGVLDGRQNRLLINKEEALRKKFEQQFQEKIAEKNEVQVKPLNNKVRVRIPDIMFFLPDENDTEEEAKKFLEKQKEKLIVLLDSVLKQVKKNTSTDFFTNYRNCVKIDERSKTLKLLEYVILFFDKVEIAEEFISILDGITFNQFCLKPHILENRF